MRFPKLHSLLLAAMVCGSLAVADTSKEEEDDVKGTTPLTAEIEKVKNSNFKRELRELDKAAVILDTVVDEKTAKAAVTRIVRRFSVTSLRPLIGGNMQELELLAKAQNQVNEKMWRLMNEPYFESAGMQKAWKIMTDSFSRPSASR